MLTIAGGILIVIAAVVFAPLIILALIYVAAGAAAIGAALALIYGAEVLYYHPLTADEAVALGIFAGIAVFRPIPRECLC